MNNRVVCRVLSAGALSLVFGCATYESPFVHKTEEELDAMELRSLHAASAFANGDYDTSERILESLASEQTVSSPLYELERVSVLLQKGERRKAHELMCKIRRDLEMLFDEKSEKEAMSLWHGENKKVFKGDVHERSTLYAFLAMSFMEAGEWDDAERCVKNGLLADSSNTEDERYNSDYALLQYLGYVACRKGGRDADAEEYQRELMQTLGAKAPSTAKMMKEAKLPNAFLVVWAGTPPTYVRGGQYDEIRHVIPGKKSPFSYFSVKPDGMPELAFATGLADVNFQATTRGGREMDSVLADKAAVKTGMEASANILLIAGLACFSAMGNNAQADMALLCVGAGCCVLGGGFYIVGNCINTTADVRSWKTMPGELLVVPLQLPEGNRSLDVNGYRLRDQVVRKRVSMDVSNDTVATAHVSMMRYRTAPNPSSVLIANSLKVSNAAAVPPSRTVPAEIKPESRGGVK